MFSGKGIMTYPDGSQFSGTFVDNLKNGKGIFTDLNQNIFDEFWSLGEKISSKQVLDN
jgi:hypothetical protein